jgi:hypothetical protein
LANIARRHKDQPQRKLSFDKGGLTLKNRAEIVNTIMVKKMLQSREQKDRSMNLRCFVD